VTPLASLLAFTREEVPLPGPAGTPVLPRDK